MANPALVDYINAGGASLVLRLVKTALEVTPNTKVSDFPPADFIGYQDLAPPALNPCVDQDDGSWLCESPVFHFKKGVGGPVNNIVGWVLFMSLLGGDTLVEWNFWEKPHTLDVDGAELHFGIRLKISEVPT